MPSCPNCGRPSRPHAPSRRDGHARGRRVHRASGEEGGPTPAGPSKP
ncbi:50S ribosomal protein L32 [Streptomyces chartreusis]